MAPSVEKADALADIRRVADELGHPPTVTEYRENGEYSAVTAAKHFDGSFVDARNAALETDTEHRRDYTDNELLAGIERVAEVVGGEPSKDDYKEHGEHALSTITYRFASWVAVKKAAGVYDGLNEGPTREELLDDMRRVDAEHSGPLSQKVYDEHGQWTSMTAKRRFPSWEDACQNAGVSRPDMGPRTEQSQELLADIKRIAAELGHLPSREEYNELGDFSRQMAIERFGSWPEAVRRAGFEPNKPGAQPGEQNGNWKGGYEPYYGRNWHEQRRAARRRDGYTCVACGMSETEHVSEFGWGLEVHHVIPVREFDKPEDANTLDNLLTLCRSHHRKYEELPAQEARELKEGG